MPSLCRNVAAEIFTGRRRRCSRPIVAQQFRVAERDQRDRFGLRYRHDRTNRSENRAQRPHANERADARHELTPGDHYVGVASFDAADAGDRPTSFRPLTVNVYGVPVASPDTTIGDAAPVAVNPPGDDVTTY